MLGRCLSSLPAGGYWLEPLSACVVCLEVEFEEWDDFPETSGPISAVPPPHLHLISYSLRLRRLYVSPKLPVPNMTLSDCLLLEDLRGFW